MKLLITGSSAATVVHELPLTMKDLLFFQKIPVTAHVINWWEQKSLYISWPKKVPGEAGRFAVL